MKLGIIAPLFNKNEQAFAQDLVKKMKAIGYQAELIKDKLDYNVLIVVFDGRELARVDYIKIGLFIAQQKKEEQKLLVAYLAGKEELSAEKKFFDRIAQSELGLINCVKEYIYHHAQKNNS